MTRNLRPVHDLSGEALADLLEALRERGAGLCFPARGRSMLPSIRDGDLVTISTAIDVPVRRGSVVAFREPRSRRLVVHRVIAIQRDGCLVRGDNVRTPDGVIAAGDVLGVVTRVERDGEPVGFHAPGRGARGQFPVSAYLWELEARFLARATLWRIRGCAARVWRSSAGCGGAGSR